MQIDYSQIIIETINTLFSNLFNSLDKNLYSLLDTVVFIDDSIISDVFFNNIFNTKYGLPFITNSMLLGIFIYYCFKLYLSPFSGNYVEKPYQFLTKILIIAICINFSQFLCKEFLNINYIFTALLRSLGSEISGSEVSFSTLISKSIYIDFDTEIYNIFSFNGLLKSFFSIGLINLLLSYSVRYILIKVLILLFPFALLSLSTNSTSWLFKSWFRAFFSLIFAQIFITLILTLLFSLNVKSNDLFSQISYICTIFILTKANSYIKELLGGMSTNISTNFFNLKYLFN